jgi:hypothetical protein
MENKIPFTSYDFWAYLVAGLMFLFALDHVTGSDIVSKSSWTIAQASLALGGAYIAGHLIASASSVILESLLVGRLLGSPRNVLFGNAKAWRWVRRILPTYFKPLPLETRNAALARAAIEGVHQPGEALYWMARQQAKEYPAVLSRLESFLNLYGFCRNIALVGFLDSGLLYWFYYFGAGTEKDLHLAVVTLLVAIGMTFRYLKFFRHYALEVFTSFAHSPIRDPGAK